MLVSLLVVPNLSDKIYLIGGASIESDQNFANDHGHRRQEKTKASVILLPVSYHP